MGHSSDVTDKQWAVIEPFYMGENRDKHFQTHSKRDLEKAVLYINKTGCQCGGCCRMIFRRMQQYGYFTGAPKIRTVGKDYVPC